MGNPLMEAAIYKLGHYDKLAETDRSGKFKYVLLKLIIAKIYNLKI